MLHSRIAAHLRRGSEPHVARTGYISQGSVQQRLIAASGRSGYQWTRKVAQKMVSVALSAEQFEAMKAAVTNERELWKTV
jgi:DNA-binding response OmpR family regulator